MLNKVYQFKNKLIKINYVQSRIKPKLTGFQFNLD